MTSPPSGRSVPEPLLLDHADALFRRGRGESAETLIRERIVTVTDPAVAAQMQVILIRSLINRADTAAALAVIERTAAIAGLPAATVRQLEGTRAWLLAQAGQGLPAAELDAMMARFVAAGDQDAQANLLTSVACTAFLAGRPDQALDVHADPGGAPPRHGQLPVPHLGAVPARHVRAGRLRAGRRAGST